MMRRALPGPLSIMYLSVCLGRVVSNMNREWMTTGRRPAGICGAGLLIAAKMHRFHRTEAQVANVVRICDGTLKKRLNEFDETSASEMTVPQFNALFRVGSVSDFIDASSAKKEQDNWAFTHARQPPALKQQEKKRKQREEEAQRRSEEGETELEDCVALEELGNQANKILQTSKALRELDHHHEAGAQITAAAKQKEAELKEAAKEAAASRASDEGAGALGGRSKGKEAASEARVGSGDERQGQEGAPPVTQGPVSGSVNSERDVRRAGAVGVAGPGARSKVVMRATSVREDGEWADDDDDEDMATEAQRDEEQAAEDAAAVAREGDERLSDVDDDEINAYIRTQEEACQRETAWNELNRDYIEKQAEKQRNEEQKESSQLQGPQKPRKRRTLDNSVSRTAHEAASKMLRNKNLSNKVNYEALEELFGGD